jgi:hypothetical protein
LISRIRKYLKKWLLFCGAGLHLLPLFFVIAIPYSLLRTALFDFNPKHAYSILEPTVAQSIGSQSVWITSPDGRASGFIPDASNLLFTNYHVAEMACENSKCKYLEVQNANTGSPKREIIYDIYSCLEWLDICVFVEEGQVPNFGNMELAEGPSDKLFMVSRESNFDSELAVIEGKGGRPEAMFIVAELSAVQGYSGSPVFSQDGKAVGLVSKLEGLTTLEILLNTPSFFFLNGIPSRFTKIVMLHHFYEALKNENDFFRFEVETLVRSLDQQYEYGQPCPSVWKTLYTYGLAATNLEVICIENPKLTEFQKTLGHICNSVANKGNRGSTLPPIQDPVASRFQIHLRAINSDYWNHCQSIRDVEAEII